MTATLSQLGEFGLIDRLARLVPSRAGVLKGIGDDAAVLALDARRYLLFTTDLLMEGVHFRHRDDLRLVGRKAMSCSVSDIAAMGGTPTYAVVSLGVPPGSRLAAVRSLYRGLSQVAKKYKVAVVGGDTIKSNKILINVALLGEVEKYHLITRRGARPGDLIFVTGRLGGSLASGRHLTFTPRVRESRFLVKNFKPTAMIDISDGLTADLGHILKAGKVGAVLVGAKIPRHKNVALRNALRDGEDFELLFTLPRAAGRRLLSRRRRPFTFYHIGEIVASPRGLTLIGALGRKNRIVPKGFKHF